MNILFVASEAVPFAKTGGLADVTGALAHALGMMGHDVRVVMPRYRAVDVRALRLQPALESMDVAVGPKRGHATVFQTTDHPQLSEALGHTPGAHYFIDQPALFDREGLYQERGVDYPDNLERFGFFCQAVLQSMPLLRWQPEIVHCHDWQTALLCAQLALRRAEDSFWRSVKTVLTVHNLAYQGLFPKEQWPFTQLPPAAFTITGLEFYGQINCLKGALISADLLTTVSPTYAREIMTPEFGCGLDGVLAARARDVTGILNGIDVTAWDPAVDPHLAARYSADAPAGKSVCKLALQQQQGLEPRHDLLIGMIQRLAEQKGIDIFVQALERLMALPLQIVILGTGDPVYHRKLEQLRDRFPGRLAVTLAFDDALAHRIEAGADVFLMPSRFEPCGLNQMYSMRYGTVPIVRRVGGLADTVTDVSSSTVAAKTATGFVFDAYAVGALVDAVQRAVSAFRDQPLWVQLIRTGMQQDFSWSRSARAYEKVYERALSHQQRDSSGLQPPSSSLQRP